MKLARPLSLRDSVIDKLETNFIDEFNHTHEQIRYFFPDCKGRTCQGLVLFHKRKTKRKKLVLDYWLKDKSKRFVIGYYDKKEFNVKHIEKRIADLRTEYGNATDLTWTQDIKVGEDLKKRKKSRDARIINMLERRAITNNIDADDYLNRLTRN